MSLSALERLGLSRLPNLREKARRIYKFFSNRPGSEYIASAYAIQGLMVLLDRYRPKSVLEIGAGIGTLSFAAMHMLDECRKDTKGPFAWKYFAVESDRFCLEELKKNLEPWESRFTIVDHLEESSELVKDFEFIILDGGKKDGKFFEKIPLRATLFIEGDRRPQRELLESVSRGRDYVCFNAVAFRFFKSGGYWVYKFEPMLDDRFYLGFKSLYYRSWAACKYRIKPIIKIITRTSYRCFGN